VTALSEIVRRVGPVTVAVTMFHSFAIRVFVEYANVLYDVDAESRTTLLTDVSTDIAYLLTTEAPLSDIIGT
jgi:hypothetical protein